MSELIEKIKEIRNNGSRRQAHIELACEVIKEVEDLEIRLEGAIDLADSAIDTASGMDADVSFLEEWLDQLKEKGE